LDLINQTLNQYELCQLDTGAYGGGKKQIHVRHLVSTWQSLKNNPAVLRDRDVVIVDECQGAQSKILHDLLCVHAAHIAHRFGVTGTLPKDVLQHTLIRMALGPVFAEVPAHELIDRGFLSKPTIHIHQLREDLTPQYQAYLANEATQIPEPPMSYAEFRRKYFDHDTERKYLRARPGRTEWIANKIIEQTQREKGNTLCLVDNIRYGNKLQKMIPNSIFVNGQDMEDPKERAKIWALFAENDHLCVIATSKIASVGIDAPRIFAVFLIDVGKSFIRVIQAIGRGIRRAADKDSVEIHDICSDLFFGKRHMGDRVSYYNEAKYAFTKTKVTYT
jgi:superfamily II DNA or RNA helicase